MTDQDNLRNRIARVLDQNFNPDQYPIMAAMFRDYAQAIIDELGLTVEEGHITGKWEDVYRTPVPDCPSNRRHNQ